MKYLVILKGSRLFLAALAVSTTLTACEECETTSDCSAGEVCIANECKKTSGSGADTETSFPFDTDTTTYVDPGGGPGGDTDTVTGTNVSGPDGGTDTGSEITVEPGEWVTLPAGGFWMGSPGGACPDDYTGSCVPYEGRSAWEQLHYVQLSQSFRLMQTEVTQGQYQEVMGWNPSHFGPNGPDKSCGDDCPVEYVSWYDAVAYAIELSKAEGLEQCYALTEVYCGYISSAGVVVTFVPVGEEYMQCMEEVYRGIIFAKVELNGVSSVYECTGYRLPTESEWEYAARAGSLTPLHPSDNNDGSMKMINLEQIGWQLSNSDPSPGFSGGGRTYPVAEKEPNSWHIYDMIGNVREWVWDGWSADYPPGDTSSPALDPAVQPIDPPVDSEAAAEEEHLQIMRGGGWYDKPQACRCAARYSDHPGHRGYGLGFRLARTK